MPESAPTPAEPPPAGQPRSDPKDRPGFWRRIQTMLGMVGFWRTICLVLVAAFILAVVRPFGGAPPLLTSVEVIASWNESISRLGIQAVYPLQEDFRVGDVLAIVGESQGKALLGKSVRVGRIPLGTYILKGDEDQPIFEDTTELMTGETIHKVNRLAKDVPSADSKKIATAIAAFPAITINHTSKSAIGAAMDGLGLGGAREGQQYEQVNILSVETYGAPPLDAAGAFVQWCRHEETKNFCKDDAWARRMLALTVSPDVLDVEDGKYTNEIELQLITRVFTTREIQTRRWITDASGAAVAISGNGKASIPNLPAAAGWTAPAAPTGGITGAPAPQPSASDAPPTTPGGTLAAQWSNESGIGLSGVFQRPVTFGYRSIRTKLKCSTPPSKLCTADRERSK